MDIVNYAHLTAEQLADLESVLSHHRSLNKILDWVIAEQIPFPTLIAQDEFTVDVIARWRDGLFMVYDTT